MKKSEVILMQKYLNSKGYSLLVDGSNGPKTKSALLDLISKIAIANGVEPELAIAVAKAESALNPYCVNQNTDKYKSIDYGLFQFNNYWFPSITKDMAFDICISTKLFCKEVKAGRLKVNWQWSLKNWKKLLSPAILSKYGII